MRQCKSKCSNCDDCETEHKTIEDRSNDREGERESRKEKKWDRASLQNQKLLKAKRQLCENSWGMAQHRITATTNIVQGLFVLLLFCSIHIDVRYCIITTSALLPSPSSSSSSGPIASVPIDSVGDKTTTTTTTSEHRHPFTSTTIIASHPLASISTVTVTPTTTRTIKKAAAVATATGQRKATNIDQIRESLVIPTSDSEREAQELYDKALKQYGSYGLSVRKVCALWEERGCKCSGTVDELTLVCRDVDFDKVPAALPSNVAKL